MVAEDKLDKTQRSQAAVQRLVASHREFLAFLHKRVGSRAIAEDILQQAFVRGIDKVDSLRDQESAVAWFYRVLRNAVVDYQRRDASATRKLEALAIELEHGEAEGDLHAAVCRCVGELASDLKPEYAEALRRVEVEGMAVKDYAAQAGISSGNAAVRVFRAREALRRQVRDACGSCAEHGCLHCHCKEP